MLDRKGFDLVSFIAGDVRGSVKSILYHIRHLPEDAAYTAIMSAKLDGGEIELPEQTPEDVARLDAMVWNTDRKLLAQIANAINLNTRVSGSWEKGKEPDFPTIGPSSWREGNKQKPKPEEQHVSVLDVMKAWGYDGGV